VTILHSKKIAEQLLGLKFCYEAIEILNNNDGGIENNENNDNGDNNNNNNNGNDIDNENNNDIDPDFDLFQ
jgi:hypothetical protein